MQAWLEYGLLICEAQFLGHDEQIEFARRFGELEFELAALSNVLEDGKLRCDDGSDDVMNILKGNVDWHHIAPICRFNRAFFSRDSTF